MKSQFLAARLLTLGQRQYATSTRPFRLAIIGSGPAGFYSAYRVMTRMQDAIVDMYERLPVPFGLVRFGVAPDHPEVKNCQDKFTEVATSPRFNFIGNTQVGIDIGLPDIQNHYDAILFTYGASKDRKLGISGENLHGVYSARAFVGWYNGLPEYADLKPDLQSGDTAVVVGQGNVALDVARTLLSGVDRLKFTDITSEALETLSTSKVNKVHVIGRRGPLQAAFTIKELRELMQIPGVDFKPVENELLPASEIKLPRAQKRMTDLLKKQSMGYEKVETTRSVSLDFLKSPMHLNADPVNDSKLRSITLAQNKYREGESHFESSAKVEATNQHHDLATSLVFRSIGYKSEPIPGMDQLGMEFDMQTGIIPNLQGRVVHNQIPIPGLYCAGWVKKGPTGVIASTMEDAFATAEIIVADWTAKAGNKPGWEALRSRVPKATSWEDWLKIDASEKALGQARGKEREKISSIDEMLAIVQ